MVSQTIRTRQRGRAFPSHRPAQPPDPSHILVDLGRVVGLDQDPQLSPEDLARWVSLLLATAPRGHWTGPIGFILPWLAERCSTAGLADSLLELFDAMAKGHLRLRSYVGDPANDVGPHIFAEIGPTHDRHLLEEIWIKGLKPRLDQLAAPLLTIAVQNLVTQHRVLRAWQAADRNWDAFTLRRSAVEPHEQDRYPEATDVVIDVARDCLEYLASRQQDVASDWCARIARQDSPILRRLAVHMLPMRQDLSADEKIDCC